MRIRKLRVLAVAQYPPLEGIPRGESPINGAISKYATAAVDLLWIFGANAGPLRNWQAQLAERKVKYLLRRGSLRRKTRGVGQAFRGLTSLWHPRVCLQLARDAGDQDSAIDAAIVAHKPDLIYLASPYAAVHYRWEKPLPVVYNSIDSLSFAFDNGVYGSGAPLGLRARRMWLRSMDRDLCARKDLIIYVSQRDADNAPYAPRNRVVVIPNGCDLDRFPPGDEPKTNFPSLLFQGSPHYRPNRDAIELIVRSIAPDVWKHWPDAVFRFVGAGNEKLDGAFARRDARLQFAGYVGDLASELKRAWIGLVPMQSGAGTKNKVLDGLASGLPVIGFLEAFSGIGVPAGAMIANSSEECASLACMLIGDAQKRAEMKLLGRASAEKLAWPRQVEAYLSAWDSVV